MQYDVTDLKWGQTWPSADTFLTLAADRWRVIPVVRRLLADDFTAVGLYQALAQETDPTQTSGASDSHAPGETQTTGTRRDRDGSFILESASAEGSWSRYSFIGLRAESMLVAQNGSAQWLGTPPQGIIDNGDPMQMLRDILEKLRSPDITGLPALTSGLVGSIGWSAMQYWDPSLVHDPAKDDLQLPDMSLVLVGDMAVVDHHNGGLWLISNVINVDGSDEGAEDAYRRATERLDTWTQRLQDLRGRAGGQQDTGHSPEISSPLTDGQFKQLVTQCQEAIEAGEVQQIVPSIRFSRTFTGPDFAAYRALRTVNPSSYMYYLRLPHANGECFSVVGASPETLVRLEAGQVMTFPIAGSRPRGRDMLHDQQLVDELLADPKERSEHEMLVDLSREDLAQVCAPESVQVAEYMGIRRFSHVMHICSTVIGQVNRGQDQLDVLTATFPAGTLSGAPKHRAVELINSWEPVSRGVYGGTVGYFDFRGNMDMAIAIRTAIIKDSVAYVQAGAGIVQASIPEAELQESKNKAAGMFAALQLADELERG